VLNKVLGRVLQPLNFQPNSNANSGYYNILCIHCNFRHCKPVLAVWLVDCPEYSDIHNLERHVCFLWVSQQRTWRLCPIWQWNTPGRITTYIECSAMPPPRPLILNSCQAMSTEDSMGFKIITVSWTTCRSPTSSIQCRSACLTTPNSGFSTSSSSTISMTSRIQSVYSWLLTTTSHKKICHLRRILIRMGRRWKKWAGTCVGLLHSLYEAEAPLSVTYSIEQLSAHWHC